MSREFPDWINPWTAAQGRRSFSGTWPLARMPRLAKLLCETGGDARFQLEFSLDTDQRPNIRLSVQAELPLLCQASLKPYLEPVERSVDLGVIDSMAEEALLPDHLDPVLVEEGRLAIVTLVEDELLLGMPQVPRNPDLDTLVVEVGNEQAPAGVSDAAQAKKKPFAGLDALLARRAGQTEQD